ncbi:uncharacterized protein LOC132705697 [Cylas formicarius]|uniref:uncharacterized protein LOC132705697 n=1 Tax=Cylas formicarius TaxID=197179 RepID=UPI002958587A|nr:uncharacterized protein LOC132705697 [Cylas formicarius]
MESLSAEVNELVKNTLETNGFVDYDVEITGGSEKGDGYLSDIKSINAVEKTTGKNLTLILKLTPTSEKFRKVFPVKKLFLRELHMYEKLLPEFDEFQNERHILNPFASVARLYGSIAEEYREVLLLENLKARGFRLCNKKEPLNSEHLELGVREYARFHSVSFAFKQLQPEKFSSITEPIKKSVVEEFMDVNEDPNKQRAFFMDTIEALAHSPQTQTKVMEFAKNWLKLFKEACSNSRYNVVSHGDCWSANLMFQYEDEENPTKPSQLRLIDWQMVGLNLPIADLSYFLYVNGGKEDFYDYKKYLGIYHNTLGESLSAFGCDVEAIYSFSTFEQQWKTYSKLGLLNGIVMLGQMVSDAPTHDFVELADKGEDIFDPKLKHETNKILFNKRINDIVTFLVENEFL